MSFHSANDPGSGDNHFRFKDRVIGNGGETPLDHSNFSITSTKYGRVKFYQSSLIVGFQPQDGISHVSWVKNSCGLTMVILQQSTYAFRESEWS